MKSFIKYTSTKKKSRENVGPLLSGTRALVTQDMEKSEVPNAFFASVFASMTSLQESQVPETVEKSEERKTHPWWKRIRLGNT